MKGSGINVDQLSKDRKFVPYNQLIQELSEILGLEEQDLILDAYQKEGGFVFTVAQSQS